MTELEFQKQVLETLSQMKQELDLIKERIVDDAVLSDEDKAAIDEALEAEKEGKLLSKEQVFD